MPKVLCILPNASDLISGVVFVTHTNGMLSEDVPEEVAARFTSIAGYELVGALTAADKEAADAEKAALLARAEAVAFKVKGNWSLERLKSEVESAEKAATPAAE